MTITVNVPGNLQAIDSGCATTPLGNSPVAQGAPVPAVQPPAAAVVAPPAGSPSVSWNGVALIEGGNSASTYLGRDL